jgi:hypothetical protein
LTAKTLSKGKSRKNPPQRQNKNAFSGYGTNNPAPLFVMEYA